MNIETFVPSVSWTTWMSEFSRLTSKQEQNKWDDEYRGIGQIRTPQEVEELNKARKGHLLRSPVRLVSKNAMSLLTIDS